MIFLVACASILAFVVAFGLLGILGVAQSAIATARETGQVMGDKTLDDDTKERLVQKASLSLMKNFAGLLVRLIALLAATFAPIYLADLAGLATTEAVTGFLLRWDVILITSIVLIGLVFAGRRLWRK